MVEEKTLTEFICDDCPKGVHADEIQALKGKMSNVEKGIFKILITCIGSVVAICAVILTGIGMANSSYQKAATLNQQIATAALKIHEQQAVGIEELKKYQDSIDDSVEAVRYYRDILNRMEDEWSARKRNEDFIMKQLYEIDSKLEKEKQK